jgi:guanylate kinase
MALSSNNDDIARRGILFILSSPSGAGKTTLGRMLQKNEPNLSISISMTTRPPRPAEEDGKDYIFVSEDKFKAFAQEGDFLEQAIVFGHHYGTPKQAVEAMLSAGKDVLFDVDWQGRQQLADAMSSDVVSVFILPPDAEALKKRLTMRAQDNETARNYRMRFAPDEISHYAEYDYIIVNKDLGDSLTQLHAILLAERMRRVRQTGMRQFVDRLLVGLKPS